MSITPASKNVFLPVSKKLFSLLENEPSEPVEEVLRHRFCTRYPQTETNGLGLGHRVSHPVPYAIIGTGWKDQPVPQMAASVVPVGLSNRY